MGEQNFPSFPQGRDQQQHGHDSSYSPRSAQGQQPSPSYYPARSQCSAPNMMLPSTTTVEQAYTFQPARLHHTLDYTPQSAVSSFNLEAHCDASLLTPISMSGSPHMSTRAVPLMSGDRMRSSPTILSPFQQWGNHDEDFRYNSPMKLKDPHSALQIHTNGDHEFPASYTSPEPYYSSFGVSATSAPARATLVSPAMYHSSSHSPAGGYSSGSYSHHSTPPLSASSTESYRYNEIPTLGAPNPMALRPATTTTRVNIEPRQSSVQSNGSCSSSGSTERPRKRRPSSKSGSPGGVKKRKKGDPKLWIGLEYPAEFTKEDIMLLSLAAGGLEWKKSVVQFALRTGQTVSVACAQMRKKRLVDRILEYNKRKNESRPESEEGDSFEENWDALRESEVKIEAGSPEMGSPRTWHEPRPAYNSYHTYPQNTPILPPIHATATTMDRICNSSGSEALQYYQRSSMEQAEHRQRQQEQLNRQQNSHQEIKREGWSN